MLPIRTQDVARVRLEEIHRQVVTHRSDLREWSIRVARHEGPGQYHYETDWQPIEVGKVWGHPGVTVFLRRLARVPSDWKGFRVGLQLETGGEGLLYLNGEPFHGVDDNRTYILLTTSAEGDEEFDLTAEMKTGGYLDWMDEEGDPGDHPHLFRAARLIAIHRDVEEAYLDFRVAFDAARAVKDDLLREAMLAAIVRSLHDVDFRRTDDAWRASLTGARERLNEEMKKVRFGDVPAKVFFTGHSHIDVAWLWPYRETMRKCGRTFSSMTALLEEFPDFHFNCSQVPLFLYTKQYYPTVYQKLRRFVEEGRFEPVGGTWVEHDTNLISGESLVRQCLYGQRFFRDEFGIRVRVGWLPDVFGYTGSMPQVYRKAGLDYFMTSKISWNDTNKFPHGTFWWEGIDGTRLFTHFIVGTYNANTTPAETLRHWEAYPSKLACPEFISSFGHGDGGGGPTREMIETVGRLTLPGIPKATTGRVHDFFDRIAASTDDLPVWRGELYFELHRGTYTSQARNKRHNRKCEILYRDAELLSMLATKTGRDYPAETLADGWKTILINQFHDVIPGSSVRAVYRDSDAMYAGIEEKGASERAGALASIAARADTRGDGIPVVVFNTLSFERTSEVSVEVPGAGESCRMIGPDGEEIPARISGGRVAFVARDVPSIGHAVYHVVPGSETGSSPFHVEGGRVVTPFHDIEMGEDGTLRRVFDRARRREVLPDGERANVLQFFEDKPANWEAWDVEPHYQEKVWEAGVVEPLHVVEETPDRVRLSVTLSYGGSTFEQEIVLHAQTPRIDFIHRVDWRERKTLCKVAFPVEIHATRATYEIAYGAIERPNHWNTSWDWARFETPGHRWADLSEPDYGVSVLNDSKYGWDIHGGRIRLSLLRSPVSPDPEADQGEHRFTYSLFPHEGGWTNGVVREGLDLNVPLLAVTADSHDGEWGRRRSFLSIDRDHVVIDAVKKTEDGDDLIIRVYEAHGSRGPVRITFDRPILSAAECNLLEEDDQPAVLLDEEGRPADNGPRLAFDIEPFEVKTFKVRL